MVGALVLSASFCMAEIPLDDATIILGKRVGPIEKGMTLFGLKTLFGGGKVKAADIEIGEGETMAGAKLFEGTGKELEIIFNPEGDEKEIWDINIIGKDWKFENGLKLGMPLTEVEKINGGPFGVLGFGWDYGGFANFEGGKLEAKVSIHFKSAKPDVDDSLIGDKLIPTTDKKLRAAGLTIDGISVFFR